ncbi:TetR family transcriptional regulator [Mycobacterium paraterrae]|uniref:TetR family transcriptional regulator n=1 Tax=Mycobacterium paraterrae TaxID=577492 RepID=A0ABY3VNK1_9MYCO|nr:TetR family transcriptional regulator [Mycobacterium paraterrae]UMB70028.1 TetR family transcriptional regulator [Mycobacterium paraterrae]
MIALSTDLPIQSGSRDAESPPRDPVREATPPQRGALTDRREAILDAALHAAAQGGYDAVQMRTIAKRAGISVGTLYAHFPSKNHLLAHALTRDFQRLATNHDWASGPATPVGRLERLTSVLHRQWQRQPLLTEAMTRIFVVANTCAAGELDHAAAVIERLLATAVCGGPPTAGHHRVAALIADIWLANLRAFIGGRASADATRDRIDRATRLLIDRANSIDIACATS